TFPTIRRPSPKVKFRFKKNGPVGAVTPPGLWFDNVVTPSLPERIIPSFWATANTGPCPERGFYVSHFSCFRQWPECLLSHFPQPGGTRAAARRVLRCIRGTGAHRKGA